MPVIFCRLLAIFVFVLSLGILAPTAKAQTVALQCTVSITTISFGSFDVLPGSAVSSNGTLSVSCLNITVTTGNLYLCVAIPARSMTGTSTGTSLAYDIYGPTPSTASWSNTTPIVVPFASLRLNQTYNVNIQAAVLGSQQAKPADTYKQTLTATAAYGSISCTSGFNNTGTFSFAVNATITKSCNVTATNLAFGSVANLNSNVDGQSTLSVQCSNGTGYSISLDGGLSGATNPAARKMTGGSGSDTVTYGLYQNSGRSTLWGASSPLGGTGNAATQSIPVYGRVQAQANPAYGTYSDTIVVSVTY